MSEPTVLMTIRLAFLGVGDAEQVHQGFGWFMEIWNGVKANAPSLLEELQQQIRSLVDLAAEEDEGLRVLVVTFGGDAESPLSMGEMVTFEDEQFWFPAAGAAERLQRSIELLFGLQLEVGKAVSVALVQALIAFFAATQIDSGSSAHHAPNTGVKKKGMKGGVRSVTGNVTAGARYDTKGMKGGVR